MEAILFLADAAQVSDGKLNALGAGWSQTSSPLTAPSAVAFILQVPWDETNRRIKWTLDLIDADGRPVQVQAGPESTAAIHIENEIEVGRPAGIKPGSSINVPFAVSVGPMSLEPNSKFEWVLRVESQEWRTTFATRPLPSG
jgi:hypothetical protein